MRSAIKFIKEKYQNIPLIGAELGVENGVHASEILAALNLKKLYLIDIWESYIQEEAVFNYSTQYWNVKLNFKDNETVNLIRGDSLSTVKHFANHSLDFIYIDANHQYEFVKQDIEIWYPIIKSNGVICGHDYSNDWKGVIQAVNEFAQEKKLKLNFAHDTNYSSDWWIEKC